MRKIILFSLIQLSVFYCTKSPAQSAHEFSIKRLTVSEGLSRNSVTDIYEDKLGFIWIATPHGLNRYDGYTFKHYFYDANKPNSLNTNVIWKIWEDSKDELWVATYEKGLFKFDRNTESFKLYTSTINWETPEIANEASGNFWVSTYAQGIYFFEHEKDSFFPIEKYIPAINELDLGAVEAIASDSTGNLWIGSTRNGLYHISRQRGEIQLYNHLNKEPKALSHSHIRSLLYSDSGKLWIGTPDGLNLWDKEKKAFKRFYPTDYISSANPAWDKNWNHILHIAENDKGILYLGTPLGLLIFDLQTQTFTNFSSQNPSAFSPLTQLTEDIIIDRHGIVWLGTIQGLALLYPKKNSLFDAELNNLLLSSPEKSEEIRRLLLSDSAYWVCKIEGLFKIKDSITTQIREGDFVQVYKDDQGIIYAAEVGNGFHVFYPDGREEHLPKGNYISPEQGKVHGNLVYEFEQSKDGKIWLSTFAALHSFDPQNGILRYYDRLLSPSGDSLDRLILDLLEDQEGNLWIASINGLGKIKTKDLSHPHQKITNLKIYRNLPNGEHSLSSNLIQNLYEDVLGRIWIGTESGLHLYRKETDDFYKINFPGKSGGNIMGILGDEFGNIWISTGSQGILRIDGKSLQVHAFSAEEGIRSPSYQLNRNYKSDDRKLFFIGDDGISAFYPDSIEIQQYPLNLKLVDLEILNNESDKSISLSQTTFKHGLKLSHEQNTLSFSFASVNYPFPNKLSYAYQLNENAIRFLDKKRSITFANLHPGAYQLRIFASLDGKSWEEMQAQLEFNILPPWWKTIWAYMAYVSLFIGTSFLLFTLWHKRKMAVAETERIRKLEEFKSKQLENVAHEIKNPLTLILNNSDLISQSQISENAKDPLARIKDHGEDLLTHIERILNLSKAEQAKLEIKYSADDIVGYLRGIVEVFKVKAAKKQIELSFESKVEKFLFDFDSVRIQHIISNLLSNAIKFTPIAGKVVLKLYVEKHFLKIEVVDNGIGIDEDQVSKIFERYTQGIHTQQEEGLGIGLAYSKKLVDLMGGSIGVKSKVDQGSTFSISLPIRSLNSTTKPLRLNSKTDAPPEQLEASKAHLLFIENNEQLLQFYEENLAQEYRISTAHNGQEGFKIAKEFVPDLIITDLKMPVLDGFGLIDKIRATPTTCYIPIMIISGDNHDQTKNKAFEKGAEAYLNKPFTTDKLKKRIKALLDSRKRLEKHYSHDQWLKKQNLSLRSRDEELLKKITGFIEENLDKVDLNIELICKEVGIGYAQLNRKMKAFTGMGVNKYLKNRRMEKAKFLLEKSDLSIGEIAIAVGFSTLNFFSREFRKQLGYSPRAYRKIFNNQSLPTINQH